MRRGAVRAETARGAESIAHARQSPPFWRHHFTLILWVTARVPVAARFGLRRADAGAG